MTSENNHETDQDSPWLQERAAKARRKAKAEKKSEPAAETPPSKPARRRNCPTIWQWHEQAVASALANWEHSDQAAANYNNAWFYYFRNMKGHPDLIDEPNMDVVADTMLALWNREDENQEQGHDRPYWRIMAETQDIGDGADLVALVHRWWKRFHTVDGESKLKAAYRRWTQRGFAYAVRIKWKHHLAKNPIGDPYAMLATVREVYRRRVDDNTPPGKRWAVLQETLEKVGTGEMTSHQQQIPFDAMDLAFPLLEQAHYVLSVFELHSREAYSLVAEDRGRPVESIEWKNEDGSGGWWRSYPIGYLPELLLGTVDASKTFGRSATACRGWVQELVECGALRRTSYRPSSHECYRYVLDVPEWVFYLTAKSLPVWTSKGPAERKSKGLSLD